MEYIQGYCNKHRNCDDCKLVTQETEDGTIRPMWLEEMAGQLKEQNNGK